LFDYDISKVYKKHLKSEQERENCVILNKFVYSYDEFDSFVDEYIYEVMLKEKTKVKYEIV